MGGGRTFRPALSIRPKARSIFCSMICINAMSTKGVCMLLDGGGLGRFCGARRERCCRQAGRASRRQPTRPRSARPWAHVSALCASHQSNIVTVNRSTTSDDGKGGHTSSSAGRSEAQQHTPAEEEAQVRVPGWFWGCAIFLFFPSLHSSLKATHRPPAAQEIRIALLDTYQQHKRGTPTHRQRGSRGRCCLPFEQHR